MLLLLHSMTIQWLVIEEETTRPLVKTISNHQSGALKLHVKTDALPALSNVMNEQDAARVLPQLALAQAFPFNSRCLM